MHSRNRAALSYSLSLNHLADRTPQELAALRGRRRSRAPNNGLPFPTELYSRIILPESLDWRMYGTCGLRSSPAPRHCAGEPVGLCHPLGCTSW